MSHAIPATAADLPAFWAHEAAACNNRHERTQLEVRRGIAASVPHVRDGRLLDIGVLAGLDTLAYQTAMGPGARATMYDWQDFREQSIRASTDFHQVDLEGEVFPHPTGHFDAVVINQVLEHLKNIFRPLSEIHRVLKPGGRLIVSVPNQSALHNCALFLTGRQPTTTAIGGAHVRGYSIHSFTKFLLQGGHFKLVSLEGYGMHPFTSARIPGPLRTWSHTPVWTLEKVVSQAPNWEQVRSGNWTSTKF